MANLLIDIGNTTLKASWAEGMTLGKTFRYQGEKKMSFILSQTSKQKPEIMVISNVRTFSNQDVERLRGECGHLIILNEEVLKERNLPSYLTPDRAASPGQHVWCAQPGQVLKLPNSRSLRTGWSVLFSAGTITWPPPSSLHWPGCYFSPRRSPPPVHPASLE